MLAACAKHAPTTGTQLPLQPARAVMALTRAPLTKGTGPALLVVDLPSRKTQTVALAASSLSAGNPRPAALATGTQNGLPWAFVLDSGSGAIAGFELSTGTLRGPNATDALSDVIPNAIAAGRNALFAVSSDASSRASAIVWNANGAQRLTLFSDSALTAVCAAAVTSGFAAVAATGGAAEVVLLDATGVVLDRMALPGDSSMRPLACNGQGDLLAVVTTGQFLTLSTKTGQLGSRVVAALPAALALGTHPRLAVVGAQTALATNRDITLLDNTTGTSAPLSLAEPGNVVALAATPDSTSLLVGLGTGAEATALVAWFFAQREEIPVTRLGVDAGLVDIAVAAEP